MYNYYNIHQKSNKKVYNVWTIYFSFFSFSDNGISNKIIIKTAYDLLSIYQKSRN